MREGAKERERGRDIKPECLGFGDNRKKSLKSFLSSVIGLVTQKVEPQIEKLVTRNENRDLGEGQIEKAFIPCYSP